MRTKEIISRSDLLKIGLREKLAVDFLTKLADIQASMVWNVPFSRGKQFPVLDENGDLFAYVFPFFRATENIPVKDDFHRFIAEYKEGIPGLTKKDELKRFFWREEKFISLFREKFEFLGSIYISATKENFPILKFTHAIHPLFFTRDEAYHKAEKYFKTEDVKLTNIFFFGPDGEYYEFESDDNKILMHPFTLEIIDRKEVINTIETSITIPELKEQVEFAWSEITDRLYDEPLTVPGFYKMIPDAELIPIFDQTYWSRPTAWTMALGYYDNFVPGKFPKLGYGRLIDYWYFNEETRTNIPNLIDKLLDEEIGAGMNDLERTVNSTCGYDFDIHHWTTGTPENEFGWLKVKQEIDSGRPLVWDTRHMAEVPEDEEARVMCAFGYGMFWNQKMIYILNMEGPTFFDQFECLAYEQWLGHPASTLRVGHIIPKGGVIGSQLFLEFPKGKETFILGEEIPIKWEAFGGMIKKVDLLFSKDEGRSWDYIEKDIETTPGMNTFFWKPKKAFDDVRLRIKGYGKYLDSLKVEDYKKKDFKSFLIAGDGLKFSFRVIK